MDEWIEGIKGDMCNRRKGSDNKVTDMINVFGIGCHELERYLIIFLFFLF